MAWVVGTGCRARACEAAPELAQKAAARSVGVLAGLAAVALAVAACGTTRAESHGRAAGGQAAGCATTVRGVVPAAGPLAAGWVPAGFRRSGGGQSGSALPSLSYQLATTRPDPPRLSVSASYDSGRLTPFAGGWGRGVRVTVQGHQGFLETGPPDPQGSGVFWKPSGRYLLSVTGYKLAGPVALKVARQVSFRPPELVRLPVAAGRVIVRQQAAAAARRAARLPSAAAAAKLSSWTEVSALLQAGRPGQGALAGPSAVSGAPWRPLWAVLLTSRPRGAASQPVLAVIDAASGRAEAVVRAGTHPAWFTALTDRDPAVARGCPGGSTARPPYGVLTRDEQASTVRGPPGAATGQARTSVALILSTVRAVNAADPGLYGGCVQQDCSLPQLVWVTVDTVRALPGKTVSCLPGFVSVPSGYHAKQVKQYFVISVPGNDSIGCGAVPGWIAKLQNLAPPSG